MARKSSCASLFLYLEYILTHSEENNQRIMPLFGMHAYMGILYFFIHIKDLSVNIKIFVVLLLKWENVCANVIT